MCVYARGRIVPTHNLQEPRDVRTQPVWRDCCVLDKWQRLGITLHCHRQAQRRLTQAPDSTLLLSGGRAMVVISVVLGSKVALERVQFVKQILGPLPIKLHDKNGAWIALYEIAQRVQCGVPA